MNRIATSSLGVFIFVFFAVVQTAEANEEVLKSKQKVGLYLGGSADVANINSYGWMLGIDAPLHQATNRLVVGVASRLDYLWGQIPTNIGINADVEATIVEMTVSGRLRYQASQRVSFIGDLGFGLSLVSLQDTMLDQQRMVQGGTNAAGMVAWGLILEFSLVDMLRLSAFYQGGVAFRQIVELGIEPIKKNRQTHKFGAMLGIFF